MRRLNAEKENRESLGLWESPPLTPPSTREARRLRKQSWGDQTESHGVLQVAQTMPTAWEWRKRKRIEMWEAPPPGPPLRWEVRSKLLLRCSRAEEPEATEEYERTFQEAERLWCRTRDGTTRKRPKSKRG